MKTNNYTIFANARSAVGTHNETLTCLSTENIGAHKLVCMTASNQVRVCGKNDRPVGATCKAVEANNHVCIQLLGTDTTQRLLCDSPVQAGEYVCLSNEGNIQALKEETGTYTIVGLALADASANNLVEVLTAFPHSININ